jgi:DNA invertase Pin-like site-specific DNA recombinase
MTVPCVRYTRKSNGRKAVPRQKAITSAHIARIGGEIIPGGDFSDADKTAWKGGTRQSDRDGFARMLDLLRSREGLRVIAWHVDRLLRDDGDMVTLAQACRDGRHVIETPTGGIYDMATGSGRKRLRDDASDAIHEVDHLQERVLEARAEIVREGRWLGGRRPFGWRPDPDPVRDGVPWLDEDGEPVRGVLRLDEDEAAAVRQACADVLAGVSLGAITRQWNAAGLTGTCGAAWGRREVKDVLCRPRNAGLMEYRGEIAGPASWPRIVDEPTRLAVKAALDRAPSGPGAERKHLLSGIALCGTCGRSLVCTTAGTKNGQRRVYVCRPKPGTKRPGVHGSRDAGNLDEYCEEALLSRLERDDARDLLLPDTTGERDRLLALEAQRKGEHDRLHPLWKSGVLTDTEFARDRKEARAALEAVRGQLAALDRADVVAPFAAEPRKAWAAARARDVRQCQAVMGALMAVTVFPGKRGRGFDTESVDVRWLPRG